LPRVGRGERGKKHTLDPSKSAVVEKTEKKKKGGPKSPLASQRVNTDSTTTKGGAVAVRKRGARGKGKRGDGGIAKEFPKKGVTGVTAKKAAP